MLQVYRPYIEYEKAPTDRKTAVKEKTQAASCKLRNYHVFSNLLKFDV